MHIEILASTGAFVKRGEPLCRCDREGELPPDLAKAFLIDRARTYEQDPRHGLTVLGEIGARALSPAVNDPGTAIEIAGVGVRIFDGWSHGDPSEALASTDQCDRLIEPALRPADLLDDLYSPIIRHGSGELSVAVRVQKALRSLERGGGVMAQAAAELAASSAERALDELPKQDAKRFAAQFPRRERRGRA